MATNVNVTSGYEGVKAGEILATAFKKAQTFDKDLITMIPQVIGSGFLPSLSYSADLQAYACGWSPAGDITYSDKEVVLKKYMIQHEICKDKFHQTFQSVAQGLWGADNEIPADINTAILDSIVGNLAAKIDSNIWGGTNSTTSFNGLLPQFVADGDVIDVAGATVSIANVTTEFAKVMDAIPSKLVEMEDLLFVVSRNVFDAYKRNVAAQGLNTTNGGDYSRLDYLGQRVEMLYTLPANTIIAYEKKNVAFLTGLVNDLNSVRISDDAERLDGILRTKTTFTAGVGYTDGSRIVYYRP